MAGVERGVEQVVVVARLLERGLPRLSCHGLDAGAEPRQLDLLEPARRPALAMVACPDRPRLAAGHRLARLAPGGVTGGTLVL